MQTENRLVDTVGEAEGGMNWESSMETHTLPCVKEIASENLLCKTGSSTWCPVTPLKRWGRERMRGEIRTEVTYVYLWLTRGDVWQRPTQCYNLFIFNWRTICFTILCWFLPYITLSQPQVFICLLLLEPPSHLPLHPNPLGCNRALVCDPWVSSKFPLGIYFTCGNVHIFMLFCDSHLYLIFIQKIDVYSSLFVPC